METQAQFFEGSSIKVSFVTVCYRTPNLIRMLLKGVEASHLQFPFEYFLVNNAAGDGRAKLDSDRAQLDGTNEMVEKRFPWVKLIKSPQNVGFGTGNNLALRQAKGEYVMLLNPDLTIFPNEIEKLVAFMDQHTDVAMAGPALFNPDGTRQDSCYHFPTPLIPFYRRTILGRTSWGKKP